MVLNRNSDNFFAELVPGGGTKLLDAAGVAAVMASAGARQGDVQADAGAFAQVMPSFVAAVAAHRHFAREADKPVM